MDERIIRQVLYCSSDVLIEGRGSAYLADIVGLCKGNNKIDFCLLLVILRFLRVAQSQAILCGRARPNVLDFAVALASFGMSYVDLIAYLENSSSSNNKSNISSSSNPFGQSCQNQLVIAAPNEESMQQQQRKHFYHFFPPLPPEYTFKRTTV